MEIKQPLLQDIHQHESVWRSTYAIILLPKNDKAVGKHDRIITLRHTVIRLNVTITSFQSQLREIKKTVMRGVEYVKMKMIRKKKKVKEVSKKEKKIVHNEEKK